MYTHIKHAHTYSVWSCRPSVTIRRSRKVLYTWKDSHHGWYLLRDRRCLPLSPLVASLCVLIDKRQTNESVDGAEED